jgi:hypothetical protein
VVVREGERPRRPLLEGNPALGIKSDPAGRPAHRILGAIDAAHPRQRELAGEEQRRLALAALESQDPLRFADVEDGGRE